MIKYITLKAVYVLYFRCRVQGCYIFDFLAGKAEYLAYPEFSRVSTTPSTASCKERFCLIWTNSLESKFSMKALAGLLWASAALEAHSVVGKALLYTSESWSRQAPVEPPSISPQTARLLLAQRLGLSRYHSLQDVDEPTLELLNTYGGEQQQIFAPEETSQGAEKLLLIVEGVDEGTF